MTLEYTDDSDAYYAALQEKWPGTVIESTFWPGFSPDLSQWRLLIDSEGNLFQDILVWRWTPEEGIVKGRRQELVCIGADAVTSLLAKAAEIGFYSLQDSYEAGVDDVEWSSITVHSNEAKTVKVSGAGWLAHGGNTDVKGYVELWRAINAYAPFPPKQ